MAAHRILYVHRSSSPTYGGALVDLRNILSRLDRRHCEAVVLLSRGNEPLSMFRTLGVETTLLGLPALRKGKSLPLLPWAVLRLQRLIRAKHISLVHVNDVDDAAIVAVACRLAGIPCVVHVRSEMAPNKFRKLRLQWADRLIAVSRGVRDQALLAGIAPERVATVYSGIDPERVNANGDGQRIRREYGIAPETIVVGSVANIVPVKGYEFLIRAVATARQTTDDLACLIVGADERGLQVSLQELGDSLGLRGRLRFAGFQETTLPYLDAMDLFMLSSIEEGFGLVLLEAMAGGKPVIATAASGPCEIVEDGRTGLLVPPRDPDAMAKALVDLLRDPKRRVQMGRAGRERVRTVFGLDSQMANLTALYDQLLRERRPIPRG